MEYTGKIIYISPIETVGQNGIQKMTVVLEEHTDKEYKGGISFDLIKDKVLIMTTYSEGDIIKVHLNFRVNYSENTKKHYTSINARRIEPIKIIDGSDDDDLPF